MLKLPLVALLLETVLPGERRTVPETALDKEGLKRLRALKPGTEVAVVPLTSWVEFPGLLAGRYATVATVEGLEPALVFQGKSRARLRSAALDTKGAFAELDPVLDPVAPEKLLQAGLQLMAALAAGAAPQEPGWEEPLRQALAMLGRAAAGDRKSRELLDTGLEDGLAAAAKALAAERPARAAQEVLEAAVRALPAEGPLSDALRRRLWSQVVELQRRLDVYDPDAHQGTSEVTRVAKRLAQAGLPAEARGMAERELKLLRGMDSSHHDYSTHLSHLDLMARLPWHPSPAAKLDLAAVATKLDESHAGLLPVKKRILEYLAVKQLGGTSASTVLCLGGPPGVGKTTIAQAVAAALGRPFVRVPLGGVHDESEVRGHRRTFSAASAGRIVSGMAQCPGNDPVMLLDEIDKIGTDRSRSPAAALLEVLDPSQHKQFQDNFLSVPYDLSNVLFIATANDLSLIDPTLRDRLEIVELEGYLTPEKVEVVQKHLLPLLQAEHGLPERLTLADETVHWLIEAYTREAGVRQLRRTLAGLHRAQAHALVSGKVATYALDRAQAEALLGPPRHRDRDQPKALPVGVSLGLATLMGQGSVLRVEAATAPGKGALVLTGSLGEVMKESAQTAQGHLRVRAQALGLTSEMLGQDLYLHVPDAASPKDGPSAGVALGVAMLSAYTGRALPADLAMTGELSLTGEVLPVGGVKAKALAAQRAGLKRLLIPADNLADLPKPLALQVIAVRQFAEVLDALGLAAAPSAEPKPTPAKRKKA